MGAGQEKADLQGANLAFANLGEARVSVEQLSRVESLYETKLDPELMEQIKQDYPQLIER